MTNQIKNQYANKPNGGETIGLASEGETRQAPGDGDGKPKHLRMVTPPIMWNSKTIHAEHRRDWGRREGNAHKIKQKLAETAAEDNMDATNHHYFKHLHGDHFEGIPMQEKGISYRVV